MDKVRYNLCCSECNRTNSWGVFESSRLRFCPFCQKNTMHYPNDSYVIAEDQLKDKIQEMVDKEENDEKQDRGKAKSH